MRIEVLEREAERIDDAVAGVARRVRAMRSRRSRTVCAFRPSMFSFSASTPGGGACGGVPVIVSRIHAPRSTGDVRFAYDMPIRKLPLPSRPKRFGSVSVHAAEPLAAHVRDAVVEREPLVHERVVRGEQVHHVLVFREHAVDEQLDLLAEARAQRVVELGEQRRIGLDARRSRPRSATGPRSSS